MSGRPAPHTKRPREEEDTQMEKENTRRGIPAAVGTASKRAPTVPLPFRAARGVAASHRQDAPRNQLPESMQHTPVSSTRTSSSNGEKSLVPRRAAPLGHRRPQPLSTVGTTTTTRGEVDGGQKDHRCGSPAPTPVLAPLELTWHVKRTALAAHVAELEASLAEQEAAKQTMQDVIESMLFAHEADVEAVQQATRADATAHEAALHLLEDREMRCRALKSRSLEEVDALRQKVIEMKEEKERVQEQTVLEHETIAATRLALASTEEAVRTARARLAERQQQEDKMKDTAYGLSGEVKDMVLEMETLHKKRHAYRISGMELEMRRRELCSRCEELKGSIRVYCRVKGQPRSASASRAMVESAVAPPSAPASARSTTTTANTASEVNTPRNSHTSRPTAADNEEDETHHDNDDEDDEEEGVEGHGLGGTLAASPPPSAPEDGRCPPREDSLASSVATTLTCASSTYGSGDSRARLAARPAAAAGRAGLNLNKNPSRVDREAPTVLPTAEKDCEPVFTFEGTVQDFGPDPSLVPLTNSPVPVARSASLAAATEATHEPPLPALAAAPPAAVAATSLHRTIHVHSVRANATSTGRHTSSESFTFDRIFDGTATQAEVYGEMEPLVHSAVDGYAVCIFAYGQTGSGKTYTMEGDMHQPELFGAIPRALQTIFARQDALAKEGWKYELSCYFVEIYNDSIRDLLQSPSVYESGGAGFGNSHFHTVKHTAGTTQITNVRERAIGSMDEFRKIHRQAAQTRRTAKTQLNERSSRSHSIFTLHITGVNSTIGQKSDGVLCLIDLAGSERVNESGVHGQQFKEAVSINRSLLDLGKCISAMRSGGAAVAPWRNSKLTYLLQHYLGAKGGKMLMLVNVSDERRHVPESLNALRFATRVSETVVGTSVKRVTNL